MTRRGAAVLISLALLLSLIVIVVDVNPPAEAAVITVDDSGGADYTTIQQAIDNASSRDTVYVFIGTYFENVIVNKTINLTGENKETTIIDGRGSGSVVTVLANWVNMSGFSVANGTYGIRVISSGNSTITHNTITNHTGPGYGFGIYLDSSSNNFIANNTVANITGSSESYGIRLDYSSNNTIINNSVSNSDIGIVLLGSTSNTVINNNASKNELGILLLGSTSNTVTNNNVSKNYNGIRLQASFSNTITNNTISSNNDYGILLISSASNTITNNELKGNGIIISGSLLEQWNTHIIDTSNTVNGKNVYYFKNQSGGSIPPDAGQVILANCTNVMIENQNVSDCSVGIQLGFSSNNTIANNSASSNSWYGIYLFKSNANSITNNTASMNNYYGLYLFFSTRNNITNNTASSNNWHGIWLFGSPSNTLSDNNASSNDYHGIYLDGSGGNIITNNIVSLNSRHGIYLYESGSSRISNNTASSNWYGIFIESFIGNTIESNTVSNNLCGIAIWKSGYHTIINNTAYSNNGYGISLGESSGNTLTNNEMVNDGIYISGYWLWLWNSHIIDTTNTVNGKPVHYWKNQTGGTVPLGAGQVILANCTNVIVENQNVSDGSDGILLGFSSNNTIANNTASNNFRGIYLYRSSSNTIVNNTATSNNYYGIYIEGLVSSDNSIYHNNFISNTNQAYDNTNTNNQWDNGYPSGGNYWSDYSGVDNFKGPNQDIPGSDGIGDTPYVIDVNSQDNYPLMNPFTNRTFDNYTVLKQGWNLISIPLVQMDQDLETVLQMIEGYYDAVQWYNNSDLNDPWKHHRVGKPLGNDLFEPNESIGFWIHITRPGDTIFLYNGTQPTSNQSIPLHPGWNMVGYPSLTNRNRTAGLNNLAFGVEVDTIWSHNATTQTWEEIGPGDDFELGKGYWVHATQDCE
jgi:parallel beta-helix repeat protein